MKVAELIKISASLLSTLANANVMPNDVRYINLYDEFCRMKLEGHKIIYIVTCLSDIYKVSEKTVYNVVRKFDKEI